MLQVLHKKIAGGSVFRSVFQTSLLSDFMSLLFSRMFLCCCGGERADRAALSGSSN